MDPPRGPSWRPLLARSDEEWQRIADRRQDRIWQFETELDYHLTRNYWGFVPPPPSATARISGHHFDIQFRRWKKAIRWLALVSHINFASVPT